MIFYAVFSHFYHIFAGYVQGFNYSYVYLCALSWTNVGLSCKGLKLHYAMGKARYLGLGRNRTRTRLERMCVAHNIKRGLSIRQEQYA